MNVWRSAICAGLLIACGAAAALTEAPVRLIPITGAIQNRNAELSGLAWCGDQLILLPQYPWEGIYRIPEAALLNAITDLEGAEPIRAGTVPFEEKDLRRRVPGFQGYEAIVIRGMDAYFAIEAEAHGCVMSAWIVRGHMKSLKTGIQLDPDSLTQLPFDRQYCNMGCEALTFCDNGLIAFYEANGADLGPAPCALLLNFDLKLKKRLPFPALPFRITDATAADSRGSFQVMNYLWSGDVKNMGASPDELRDRYGIGKTHQQNPCVERVVNFTVTEDGIRYSEDPVLPLELDGGPGRNWEGLVRWGDRGFLAVTDRHPPPITLLGWIQVKSDQDSPSPSPSPSADISP